MAGYITRILEGGSNGIAATSVDDDVPTIRDKSIVGELSADISRRFSETVSGTIFRVGANSARLCSIGHMTHAIFKLQPSSWLSGVRSGAIWTHSWYRAVTSSVMSLPFSTCTSPLFRTLGHGACGSTKSPQRWRLSCVALTQNQGSPSSKQSGFPLTRAGSEVTCASSFGQLTPSLAVNRTRQYTP